MPARGTAYTVVLDGDANNALVFVGRRTNGSIVDLPSAVRPRIAAESQYLSVGVSDEKAALDPYGIEPVMVRAVGNLVLTPVPFRDDARPLAASDVAQVLTTLRLVTERAFGENAGAVVAARIIRDAANALSRKRYTRRAEHGAAGSAALMPGGAKRLPKKRKRWRGMRSRPVLRFRSLGFLCAGVSPTGTTAPCSGLKTPIGRRSSLEPDAARRVARPGAARV